MNSKKTFLCFAILCFGVWPSTYGQDEKSQDQDEQSAIISAEDAAKKATNESKPQMRKQIERGVVVYGRPHRFAEVGNAGSFDNSPDGRTLAFAGGKVKFFDLEDNEVTDEIGESGEHYQRLAYSPDGRYVLAQTHNSKQGPMVRVFDAIDKSSVGTILTNDPSVENSNHSFYVQGLSVSPDANYVVMWTHNQIQVREVDSGTLSTKSKTLVIARGLRFLRTNSSCTIRRMVGLRFLILKPARN